MFLSWRRKRKVLRALLSFATLYVVACMLTRPLPYFADAVVTSLWLTPWGIALFLLFSRFRRKILWAAVSFLLGGTIAGMSYHWAPRSAWELTVEKITKLRSFVEEYREAKGLLPGSTEDLLDHLTQQGASTCRLAVDGWGRPIVLTRRGGALQLRSRGRDGKLGTWDDIVEPFPRNAAQKRER